MIRYEHRNWRLSLNAQNILDRQIEYNCDRSGTVASCLVQEPLTLTARLARTF